MYTADLLSLIHKNSLTIQYPDYVAQLARAGNLDKVTDKIQNELTATSLWELKWRIHSIHEKFQVTYFHTQNCAASHVKCLFTKHPQT